MATLKATNHGQIFVEPPGDDLGRRIDPARAGSMTIGDPQDVAVDGTVRINSAASCRPWFHHG